MESCSGLAVRLVSPFYSHTHVKYLLTARHLSGGSSQEPRLPQPLTLSLTLTFQGAGQRGRGYPYPYLEPYPYP